MNRSAKTGWKFTFSAAFAGSLGSLFRPPLQPITSDGFYERQPKITSLLEKDWQVPGANLPGIRLRRGNKSWRTRSNTSCLVAERALAGHPEPAEAEAANSAPTFAAVQKCSPGEVFRLQVRPVGSQRRSHLASLHSRYH